MQRCERWHGFQHVLLETGIIIVAALLLMALIMLNFRDFVGRHGRCKALHLVGSGAYLGTVVGSASAVYSGGVLPGRLLRVFPYRRCSAIPRGRRAGSVRCCLSSLQAWHSLVD